ncbi:hypothetical protein [Halomonas dongshanensis]|uniref:Uncharacterized protein n=1 Tax=Halomonas dongshanensis TaxID=2890835 RepID=A0ABT2E944_9GAMM|nr:hypothetical protein [Halomonas dongshanensis]MCS2608097.1 hypothetical protein [Halomonas dongshanensis]
MLSAFIYVMIFVGVTVTLYQLYEVNYAINFGNKKKLSPEDAAHYDRLAAEAARSDDGEGSGFAQAVREIFGADMNPRLVRSALAENEGDTARALLRRKHRITLDQGVCVRHLPFWSSRPPRWDVRGLLIALVIINSLFGQFLGGMSIYTLLYPITMSGFTWLNDPLALMIAIFALVPLTYAIARLDLYLNDLYRIGRLTRDVALGCGPLTASAVSVGRE